VVGPVAVTRYLALRVALPFAVGLGLGRLGGWWVVTALVAGFVWVVVMLVQTNRDLRELRRIQDDLDVIVLELRDADDGTT
jgi:hypothetical protein